jgi:hypothetical protein
MPKPIADAGPPLTQIIQSIRGGIADGRIESWRDMPPVIVRNEGSFWYEFNRPINFLKHAKNDPKAFSTLSKVNNDELLMRASAVFCEVTHRKTPEIDAFYIFISSDLEGSDLPERAKLEFCKLSRRQKRQRCLAWLRKQRVHNRPA